MSYEPIDFKNKPIKLTPVSADNLNYMQQGILLGVNRSKNALDLANSLNTLYLNGELQGRDGPQGPQGDSGPQGPIGPQGPNGQMGPKGDDGRPFEIDGIVSLLTDLPDPSLHPNQIWLTNEFGHLHFSTGTEWRDWGQFTGIQGEEGPQGADGPQGPIGPQGPEGPRGLQGIQGPIGPIGENGTIDIDALTPIQLSNLYHKLTPYSDVMRWHYKTSIEQNKTAKVPVGDLNLTIDFTNYGSSMMTYKAMPIDTQKPSTFYIKRLANYDLVAWEGTASASYQPQAVGASGFVLDSSAYYAGREDIKVSIYDPFNQFFYIVTIFGNGLGSVVLMDVEKLAVQGRIVVDPV